MAERDSATAAAEAAAKELVKIAYGDLLQPSAREVGAELHEFVRAIMVAGRGFGYLIRETYEPFVLRALNRVPKECRVPPSPPLLGHVLEGISYEPEGSLIFEMFENLLSNSMNTDHRNKAHPSFAQIIRSLSSDEALMLQYLSINQISVFNPTPDIVHIGIYDSNQYDLADAGVKFFDNAGMYVEHLYTLGLLAWDHNHQTNEVLNGVEGTRSFLSPSIMGKVFINACTTPPTS